jgi:hypothetical protein
MRGGGKQRSGEKMMWQRDQTAFNPNKHRQRDQADQSYGTAVFLLFHPKAALLQLRSGLEACLHQTRGLEHKDPYHSCKEAAHPT